MALRQRLRAMITRAVHRMPPAAADRVRVLEHRSRIMGAKFRGRRRGNRRLAARLEELEAELMQQRWLNRRVAELADVVEELLVATKDRDEARLTSLLDAQAPRRPRA
jgi:predicted RNase H-like nuclease (RuvC/YqgF family)